MTEQHLIELLRPDLECSLGASGLSAIHLRSSEDFEGRPTLELILTFEGRGRPVDKTRLLSAVAEARERIASTGEQRFVHVRLDIPDADESKAA